jgi:hypothetical protein
VGVVEDLEAVDVEHRQAEGAARPDAALVLLFHQFAHVAAVDQAGQLVARGQFADAHQRRCQVLPLAARPQPHRRQAPGQQRHRRRHRGHQQEVAELQRQWVPAPGAVAGHAPSRGRTPAPRNR